MAHSSTITPVSKLTPDLKSWTIRIIVKDKSEWCPFGIPKKMFYFFGRDKSGTINIAAVGSLVDRFFPILQNEHVYFISGGIIKEPPGTSTSHHPYEIKLTSASVVTLVPVTLLPPSTQQSSSIPHIARIPDFEVGAVFSIVAVVNEAGGLQAILPPGSNSEAVHKRELVLIDDTNHTIHLILWSHLATNYDSPSLPIIHATSVMLMERNETIILSSTPDTTIVFNDPNVPTTPRLTQWYDQARMFIHPKPLTAPSRTTSCTKCNRSFTPQCCRACEDGIEASFQEDPTE